MLKTLIKTLILDKCIDVLFNRVIINFTSNNIVCKGYDLQPCHSGMHIKVICPINQRLGSFEGRVVVQERRDYINGVNYLSYLLYDIITYAFLGEIEGDHDITFL